MGARVSCPQIEDAGKMPALQIAMLQIIRSTDEKALDRLLRARQTRLEEAEPVARRILDGVRRQGDRALVRYARRFDGVDLRQEGFTVNAREVREACRNAPRSVIAALR